MLHFEIINIDAAPKDFCLKVWPGGRNLANLLILSTGQIPSDGPGLKAEMHKTIFSVLTQSVGASSLKSIFFFQQDQPHQLSTDKSSKVWPSTVKHSPPESTTAQVNLLQPSTGH